MREGNDTTVFVAADNKAQRRVVELGLADGEHVEVVEGLKAGDLVITRGQNGLPDGAQISVEAGGADERARPRRRRKMSIAAQPSATRAPRR